jgi:hypothetical protein
VLYCCCTTAGENALPRFDRCAYEQMLAQCTRQALQADGTVVKAPLPRSSIAGFTYLRLGPQVLYYCFTTTLLLLY